MKLIFPIFMAQSLLLVYLFTPVAHGELIDVVTLNGQAIEFYKDYHALVVGVENYRHWPPRANAVRDARDVSWELRRLGFSVRLLTDPTEKELRLALEEFVQGIGQEVKRGLVFYYVGQSQTSASADGNKVGWIIPTDAPLPEKNQQGFEKRAISTEAITAIAGQIFSKHALFLFDTSLSAYDFQVKPKVMQVISEINTLPARQFITAGAAGAETPVLVNSEFKSFLLLGLRGEADLVHDGVVSGSELGLYLSDRVSKVTGEQFNPQYGRIVVFGENRGDFIFKLTDRTFEYARLFVETQPASAKIRIMNIKPRFIQGVELEPGKYRLHVSAEGYETTEKWIDLHAGEDRTENLRLSKKKTAITNGLGMRFIRIRPGSFMMGSPASEPGHSSGESRHHVKLTRPFFMQTTEVTVGQFKQFVQSTRYRTEAEKNGGCWITGSGKGWRQKLGTNWRETGSIEIVDGLPVNCITWNDADAFARWLSKKEGKTYRLPTEAQWEYACRAGTSTPFSTGRCLSTDEANYGKTGHLYQKCMTVFRKNRSQVIEAGTLAPNPWKLHNMHGNVSEWCLDWYGLYSSGHTADPQGTPYGSERVMRGGHWQADAAGCRSAKRWRFPPNMASDVVGFRLVLMFMMGDS
jgi:formylglycine-generating enzyme required for sulfatase activity